MKPKLTKPEITTAESLPHDEVITMNNKLKHEKHLTYGAILNLNGAEMKCALCKKFNSRLHFTQKGGVCEKCWQDNK